MSFYWSSTCWLQLAYGLVFFFFLIPLVLIQPLNKLLSTYNLDLYRLKGLCMVWRRVLKSLKQVLLSNLVGLWEKKKGLEIYHLRWERISLLSDFSVPNVKSELNPVRRSLGDSGFVSKKTFSLHRIDHKIHFLLKWGSVSWNGLLPLLFYEADAFIATLKRKNVCEPLLPWISLVCRCCQHAGDSSGLELRIYTVVFYSLEARSLVIWNQEALLGENLIILRKWTC